MKGRSNWITEDIHDAGNGRGLSLLEEPLLVLRHRTRTWNGTRRSQQPFRVQSSAAVSPVMRKKELLPGHRWIVFFFKRVDRIEFSKEPNPVPTTSGVSEIAACPPSPVADDPSAPLSPISSPSSVSNSSCLFTRCQPLHSSCCSVLFKVKMLSLFLMLAFYVLFV